MSKKKAVKEAKPIVIQTWKNRIVGHAEVPPSEIVANDLNWRIHLPHQRNQMKDILSDIGWIDELIINSNSKKLINGHMRLEIALEQGESLVPVKYVDLTDEEERKALLTFDTISLMAQQDRAALAKLRESVKGQLEEVAKVEGKMQEALSTLVQSIPNVQAAVERGIQRQQQMSTIKEKLNDDFKQTLEGASNELPGIMELKEFPSFPSNEPYDIPELRADMCCSCPEPIRTWTTPDGSPDSSYYLTIIGNGNVRGIPWERTVLCCHTYDDYLEIVWATYMEYAKKILNRKMYACTTPEFTSAKNMPLAWRIWNTFRNRWVGRYWQEAGIKIIPSVSHINHPGVDEKFIYAGIPKGLPCISVELHAMGETSQDKTSALADYTNSLQDTVKHLAPQSLLVYGNKGREDIIQSAKLPKNLHVVSILDFMGERSEYLKTLKH